MQTIKAKNAELNNEVVILTYGMLMEGKDLQILKDIAKQEGQGVTRPPDVTVSILRLHFHQECCNFGWVPFSLSIFRVS